jgi:hypothetical protein
MARPVELAGRQHWGGSVFVNPGNVTSVARADKANLALQRLGGVPVVLRIDNDHSCVADGPIEDVVHKLDKGLA